MARWIRKYPIVTGVQWTCTADKCNSSGILFGGRWKNCCPLCGNTDIDAGFFTCESPKPQADCKLILSEKKGRNSAFNPAAKETPHA